MSTLTLFCPRLVASAAGRTLTGLLLPFGEPGRTNLGRLTATAESQLTVPTAPVILNNDHVQAERVGVLASVEHTPAGLRASFTMDDTDAGNAALAEARLAQDAASRKVPVQGLRAALSIEVDPIVTRAGRIVSGVIAGAALVARGAFPSALLAADAPDVPDLGDAGELPAVEINGDPLPGVTAVEVTPARIAITTDPPSADTPAEHSDAAALAASAQPEGTPTMPNPAAPVVQNAALAATQAPQTPARDANALFAAVADGFRQHGKGPRLEAALSDIVPANILGIEQPQYVGQLWNGVTYERRYIPLFDHADLTSFNITGWDWADGKKPKVDLYAGNKTDIPSNAVETVAVPGVLQRIAGGHDIDRKFRDFSNAEFWEAYFAAMTESYAKVSDQWVRDQVKTLPTAGNGQRVHLLTGAAPAGVPTVLWQVVEGCVKMLDDLDTLPTFAMVTSDYWKPLFYTQQNQVLAYLNLSLGLKEGTLEGNGFRIVPVPVGSLTVGGWVGKTMVGHKSALKVHELPGSPIRVEADALAKGGIDEALFGYAGYLLHEVKGLISFDAPAAA